MTVALSPDLPQNTLRDLIVADIAPARADLSSEFQGYVKGMVEIEKSELSSRKEAQETLKSYEPVSVRSFDFSGCFDTDVNAGRNDPGFPLDEFGPSRPSAEISRAARHYRASDQGHWLVPLRTR